MSPAGLASIDAAVTALGGGGTPLTLGRRLRERGLGPARAAAVADAGSARRRAEKLGDDSDRLVVTGAALEQASHPQVAGWRAARFAEADRAVDLCAGVGMDSGALAAATGAVVSVEGDEALAVLLRHNLAVRGLSDGVAVGDARTPPVRLDGPVFADPGRRRRRRRVTRLAAYRPPAGRLLARLGAQASGAGVAVSPTVDLSDPGLPAGGELEFIQLHGRLVEAVVWIGQLRRCRASATLLPDQLTVHRHGAPVDLPVGPIARWLLEPVPALVRARLHHRLGGEVDARRVARRRALLTTAGRPPRSGWWRVWRVEAVLPPRPARVRAWLRDADDQPVELATHGMDVDVESFWRALGRPRRGPQARRIHLVRLDDAAVAVVCQPG